MIIIAFSREDNLHEMTTAYTLLLKQLTQIYQSARWLDGILSVIGHYGSTRGFENGYVQFVKFRVGSGDL